MFSESVNKSFRATALNGHYEVLEKASRGQSAPMNTSPREPGGVSGASLADRSSEDMAWCVLEAANDLGDVATVEACRRIIDANLSGRLARWSDMKVIVDYFR